MALKGGEQLTELKVYAREIFGEVDGVEVLGGDGLPEFRDWLRGSLDAVETAGGSFSDRQDPDDGDSVRRVREKLMATVAGYTPPAP